MTKALPEVWLRGPIERIDALLQPVAHSFLQVAEDIRSVVVPLSSKQIWFEPGGAASIGFHARHVAGSIDRLLTYARGETLSEVQRSALASEGKPGSPLPSGEELYAEVRHFVDAALAQLRETNPATLAKAREVGRAKLPSTIIGLIFHAAEHAQRHTGQIITTAKIVQGLHLLT
jgi:hypothetical protein